MEALFLNDWAEKNYNDLTGREAMKGDFEINNEHLRGAKILLASYGQGGYEGEAFVLFERDGKLYEVNASHCSCYGLEGQWDEEETDIEVLRHRLKNGEMGKDSYCDNEFADELSKVLADFEAEASAA
ncbi:hypothetical protein KAR91_78410 [Candidatus Pacearchaeota archaeon]|nr:hypothetical protein [Candidatus Pacearchaeota archaeon]